MPVGARLLRFWLSIRELPRRPAFIKALMRRSAQFQIELGGGTVLQQAAIDSGIEEMVFIGGTLNLKLLGGSTEFTPDA